MADDTRISPPSQKTIYNFKLVVGHTTKQRTTVICVTLKCYEPEVENVARKQKQRRIYLMFTFSESHAALM